MSKQVVTSSKHSSVEVVDSLKLDNELVFEDLNMEGTALVMTASEDIVISSTGTETPWGVSILSVGPVTSSSTESTNWVLSGFDDGTTQNDGSVVLGHSTATTPVAVVEAAYDGTADETRLGFFAATPVAQPTTAITGAVPFAANTSAISDGTATYGGYTVGQLVAALQALGIIA